MWILFISLNFTGLKYRFVLLTLIPKSIPVSRMKYIFSHVLIIALLVSFSIVAAETSAMGPTNKTKELSTKSDKNVLSIDSNVAKQAANAKAKENKGGRTERKVEKVMSRRIIRIRLSL
jgi:hypothetical protein